MLDTSRPEKAGKGFGGGWISGAGGGWSSWYLRFAGFIINRVSSDRVYQQLVG